MKKHKKRDVRRLLLWRMRFPLCAFAVLGVLALLGTWILRGTMLRNAYETATALSRSYAAEVQGNLNVYETLLTFGASALEDRMDKGESQESLEEFLDMYFSRLAEFLGDGVVDPYVVLEREILAANPWEGDAGYDYASAPWYQQAMEAPGTVVFTQVYTDVIYNRPVITAAQSFLNGRGVAAFDILPERLRFDTVELAEGESFFLCDQTGAIIYQDTDLDFSQEELRAYLADLVGQAQSGTLEANPILRDTEGKRRGVYYTQMDNGWYSILTVPYREILGGLQRVLWPLLLMFGISFAAMTVFALREQRQESKTRRANETARVLGNTYYALYRVDFERETYEMIKGSSYVRERIPKSGPYADLLRTAGEVIEADAYRDFTESFSCDNIRELVRNRDRDFGGEFLRRFGEENRWVSVRVLFDETLAPEEVVLCFREVEAEKQRQMKERQLLEETLQMTRQDEKAKQSFFSSMSHDMRTPLNAILGSCELAQRHLGNPAKLSGYLDKIGSSGKYLLGLINDILEMARMEHGQVSLDYQRFDLRACVEECLSTFRIQAERENKKLLERFNVQSAAVLGDDFRIQQVLNNLLSNAFKFTPEQGEISLSVEQLDEGEYTHYKFVVTDTGIGMSPDFLKRVFEPYAREMRFSNRQASGTGLGMSITKNLVTQMGGEIRVESTPGSGSAFTVILPLAPAGEVLEERETTAARELFSLKGRQILLAEDNDINMEIATEMLESTGAFVTQAWNGQEAVELFQQSQSFCFDAVLLDMQMPVMDGCEAARAIRSMDRPDAASVPLVAVTANAFSEDMAATAEAGMDAHISKPLDYAVMLQTLERLLR